MLNKIAIIGLLVISNVYNAHAMDASLVSEKGASRLNEAHLDAALCVAAGKKMAEFYKASLTSSPIDTSDMICEPEAEKEAFKEIIEILLAGRGHPDYEDALLCYTSYNQGIYKGLKNVKARKIHQAYLNGLDNAEEIKRAHMNFAFYQAVLKHARAIAIPGNGTIQESIIAFARTVEAIQEKAKNS